MESPMDDKKFLQLAIDQARKSVELGGFPAGAVIVKDGKVIAEGVSTGFLDNDPTEHAETASIRAACQNLQTSNLEGATLYESLECCLMCLSVAYWGGVSRIVTACRKTPEMVSKLYYEGHTDIHEVNDQNNRKIELAFIPDFEQESLEVVREWEQKNSTQPK